MPKIEKYVYYIFSENISSVCNPMQVVDFLKFFFSFYHNKIDPVTNYKAIKNKINKTRHHRQQDTHTHTHTHKENEMKLLLTAPSVFILNRLSINHMINRIPFL